ncbi:metallophosphoesterase [Fusobacterium simiae]|uniref:Metallophosphoesterase n=1 Tax=Fusobacterium simiae TaxID=855 RepID=A0ABT4DKU5_FUSSI|nr:metallophosphoesterase [Fusobacterium simiae]MCY7007996.1 metallophosphoesterase [Fusobacterium simiae]
MNRGTIIRKKQIKYINEDDYNRIFVISDLHGNYELFLKFIKKVNLQKDDLLINLGDSCDRGTQSYELYLKYDEMIKEGYNILHILGNHEDMLLTAVYTLDYDRLEHWFRNSGEKTIESFKRVTGLSIEDFFDLKKNKFLIDFLSSFPTLIVSDKTIFTHAAYNPDLLPEEQEEYFLIWNRENFWDRNKTGKSIYFGHTPSKKEDHTIVYYPNNCTCIDLGTYRYNKMGGIEIKNKEEYYIEILYQGDNKSRFVLGEVTGSNPLICFGINPSNAKLIDGRLQTDKTIEKIKSIADMENYDGWIMLNLYAQVTSEPNNLDRILNNSLHSKNIDEIEKILNRFPNSDILACWGNCIEKRMYLKYCLKGLKINKSINNYIFLDEIKDIKGIISLTKGREWFYRGVITKKGHPNHQVRTKQSAKLEKFNIKKYIKNL